MKTCKDCIHYQPARDPYTKAIRRSIDGHCTWPIPEKWPLSMLGYSGSSKPIIHRDRVYSGKRADECKCFEPKRVKKSTQTKIEGI